MSTTRARTSRAMRKPAAKERSASGLHGRPAEVAVEGASDGMPGIFQGLSGRRIVLLICILSSLTYANSLGGDFVFDDIDQIVENHDIRSWGNVGRAFTTHVWAFRERPDILRAPIPPPYYRPVFTVVFTAGYQMFGLWPQGWHLLTLLLHILCSVGIFYVLLMLSGRKSVAAISALLFAVFPLHSESVSWISGMTDPLFGVFFLSAFYYYLKFRESGRRPSLLASLGMFAVAAFSKETALSLVPLVFTYELIDSTCRPGGERENLFARLKQALLYALPFAGVAVLYLIPRYLVLGGFTWKTMHSHDGPFTDTLITLPWVVVTYLGHLLWPVNLSIAYFTSFVTSAASPRFLLPALALALIAGALILNRKRLGREFWLALALIFVPLLPVLDLRRLSVEYLIFDRYLYLSSGGWCYLIALGLERLAAFESDRAAKSKSLSAGEGGAANPAFAHRFSLAALVVLLPAFTAATARENRNWADAHSLWSNAARVRPAFWAAHYNQGLALMTARRYGEAREALNRAAALAPNEPFVFDALGRTSDAMGDRAGAVENFKRALAVDPETFESLNNLGTVYFKAGDYVKAERCFLSALEVKPQATPSRFNLAKCYTLMARYPEAVREFEQVVAAAPDDAEAHYELGLAYGKSGRSDDASRSFQRALSATGSQELAERAKDALSRVQARKQ